jgi:hypothetical protein
MKKLEVLILHFPLRIGTSIITCLRWLVGVAPMLEFGRINGTFPEIGLFLQGQTESHGYVMLRGRKSSGNLLKATILNGQSVLNPIFTWKFFIFQNQLSL